MAAANNEFFEALSMLEHERGITAEYLIEKIKAAIIIAVKKNYEVEEDHVKVDIDPAAGRFDVALIQDVVADEDWYDEHSEIGITEAQKIRKSYEVGDRIVTPLKTKDFGRIAAQTAKHVIRQGIREAERSQQLSEIQSRAHDIVQATVTRVDPEKGIVALDLGKGGEAILPHNEQVPGEVYTEGQTLQVYVVDVVSTERGPRVMISRTHPGLVKRLFDEIGPVFAGVPGGYTRILKLAMPRKGDNAPMAFIELTHSAEAVATEAPKAAEEAPAKPKRTRKPKAEEAGAVTEEAGAN